MNFVILVSNSEPKIRNHILDLINQVLSELRLDPKEAIMVALRIARMYYYQEAKKMLQQEFSKAETELLKIIGPYFEKLSRKTKEKLLQIMRWD